MKVLSDKKFSYGVLITCVFTLAACSGGSGQENQPIVPPEEPPGTTTLIYQGPAAANNDIQSFKRNIWDNLAMDERCGGCHYEGNQAPYFVRRDDINQAYEAASALVDLTAPSLSTLVTKVGGGHNCWRDEPTVCADTITNFIEAWAGEAGAEVQEIVLTPPPEREVGVSLTFPVEPDGFNGIHTLLVSYCGDCHAEDTDLRQQPYIASQDIAVAYEGARTRISLDNPENSRLVQRPRVERHNCGENCATWADNLEAAIAAYASVLTPDPVPEGLRISHALTLVDGIVATSGGRIETDVIALYDFKPPENGDRKAYDTSGRDSELDLEFDGDVEYVGGWGIRINEGATAYGRVGSSEKLYRLITASGEYSIETWLVPANVSQDGPARIISYTGGVENRNFTLGQTLYNYNFLSRNADSDANGMPMLSTPDADEVLQATLQHVVATFDPIDGRRLYVNGERVAVDDSPGGNLNDWDDSYALYLGADPGDEEPWMGVIKFLAIHNRALEQEHITTNFEAGVGEKRYLLFGVSHLLENVSQAYILFEVSQFDSYSYLFNAPRFISLDPEYNAAQDIQIQGLRIGINGSEAEVGQAFANVDITITSSNYNAGAGVALQTTPSGTIVELQLGQASDQFFLSFDRMGSSTSVREQGTDYVAPTPVPIDYELADIGVRNFGEINATLSTITRVPQSASIDPNDVNRGTVVSLYNTVKQQLPVSEAVDGFLAAHQAGVMQLSVAYCTALVNNDSLRSGFFGASLDITIAPGTFFNASGRAQIITPLREALLAHLTGMEDLGPDPTLGDSPLGSDPLGYGVSLDAELDNLIDNMISTNANTKNTVIAACATAVGSAAMTVQ